MTAFKAAHDLEIWRELHGAKPFVSWRSNKPVPEVFLFDQAAPSTMTRDWQFLAYDLNPGMTPAGFHSLYKWDRAFSNGGVGYEFPPGPPRRDWISKLDMGARDMRFDKARICGGAIVHGRLNGNTLTVEALDARKKPPTIEWLLDHPWLYFEAITIKPDGSNGRFPQNEGRPVYIPLMASGKITVKVDTIREGKPYPWLRRL